MVTATDETRARQYLRDIGILELFDAVICANMVERGKPFPDVYLYACEKIQKNRRTVWRWRILQTESGRRMAPDVMW